MCTTLRIMGIYQERLKTTNGGARRTSGHFELYELGDLQVHQFVQLLRYFTLHQATFKSMVPTYYP